MPELPVVPDGTRSAAASIGGYAYQIWYSLLAFLNLDDDDAIVLEGAEDLDLLKKNQIEAWQLRHTQSSLTLGTAYVRAAIENYFNIRASNPGRAIRYRYVTTSKVTSEAGHPFGPDVKGIELWQKPNKSAVEIRSLREFLLGQNLSDPVKRFIRESPDPALEWNLFQGIQWDAGRDKVPNSDGYLEADLIAYSQRITSPFIYVGVDVNNKRAYWRHISSPMVELKEGNQSCTLRFDPDFDSIGSGFPFFDRWLLLVRDTTLNVSGGAPTEIYFVSVENGSPSYTGDICLQAASGVSQLVRANLFPGFRLPIRQRVRYNAKRSFALLVLWRRFSVQLLH